MSGTLLNHCRPKNARSKVGGTKYPLQFSKENWISWFLIAVSYVKCFANCKVLVSIKVYHQEVVFLNHVYWHSEHNDVAFIPFGKRKMNYSWPSNLFWKALPYLKTQMIIYTSLCLCPWISTFGSELLKDYV